MKRLREGLNFVGRSVVCGIVFLVGAAPGGWLLGVLGLLLVPRAEGRGEVPLGQAGGPDG